MHILFKPFFREDKVLNQKTFLNYEVQFNLFHYIIEGKEISALKTCDNNAIAIQNPGHAMWLWVNEKLEKSTIDEIINSLCNQPEQRKKGYASAMVAELCSRLIKVGFTPMLYADIKNCDSNKVYKSVGFIESGRIDNIVFDYK